MLSHHWKWLIVCTNHACPLQRQISSSFYLFVFYFSWAILFMRQKHLDLILVDRFFKIPGLCIQRYAGYKSNIGQNLLCHQPFSALSQRSVHSEFHLYLHFALLVLADKITKIVLFTEILVDGPKHLQNMENRNSKLDLKDIFLLWYTRKMLWELNFWSIHKVYCESEASFRLKLETRVIKTTYFTVRTRTHPGFISSLFTRTVFILRIR